MVSLFENVRKNWGRTLTKDTNLNIADQLPEEYFPKVEAAHPGALASQWIPEDPELWKIERFGDFLEARKTLLATELNRRMEELLHGDTGWTAPQRQHRLRWA